MHFYFDRQHTTLYFRIVMQHNQPTGAGDSAARILDVKDAVFASHDYNKGPQTCLVHDIGEARLYHKAAQWESLAHSMATILGQWIDEGKLADIADLKRKASAILDKYEGMEEWQS